MPQNAVRPLGYGLFAPDHPPLRSKPDDASRVSAATRGAPAPFARAVEGRDHTARDNQGRRP